MFSLKVIQAYTTPTDVTCPKCGRVFTVRKWKVKLKKGARCKKT